MPDRSFANGNGSSEAGPDMRLGSPLPMWFRNWEWLAARSTSTSSWDLL